MERIGVTGRVFLLSMIILMPIITPLVRKSGAHRLRSAVKESNMSLGLKGDKRLEDKVTITITQKDMLLRYRSILVGK